MVKESRPSLRQTLDQHHCRSLNGRECIRRRSGFVQVAFSEKCPRTCRSLQIFRYLSVFIYPSPAETDRAGRSWRPGAEPAGVAKRGRFCPEKVEISRMCSDETRN